MVDKYHTSLDQIEQQSEYQSQSISDSSDIEDIRLNIQDSKLIITSSLNKKLRGSSNFKFNLSGSPPTL